ncbi:MAG: hypothetical protein AAF492_28925, partial [Verrucomicrobiota bacterium]
IDIYLNTVIEQETVTGTSNDNIPNAQDLNPDFIPLGLADMERAVVIGEVPSTSQTSTIYSNGFEGGVLGPEWMTWSSQAGGRIQISNSQPPAEGNVAVLMDTTGGSTLNEMILTLDLSSFSEALLDLHHAEWGDEQRDFSGPFVDHFNADGVAISADGINWFPVLHPTNQPNGVWSLYTIDLAAEAATAGIPLNNSFQIKFQQFDNAALTTDGRGWDGIKVYRSITFSDWYRVDLSTNDLSTFTLKQLTTGNGVMSIHEANSNQLVAVTSTVGNAEFALDGWRPPYNGAFYVQIQGNEGDYALMVTRKAAFNLEPNDDETQAQPIDGFRGAFGYVSAATSGGLNVGDDEDGGVIDSATLPLTLNDADGFIWDMDTLGSIGNGSIDAFDG